MKHDLLGSAQVGNKVWEENVELFPGPEVLSFFQALKQMIVDLYHPLEKANWMTNEQD